MAWKVRAGDQVRSAGGPRDHLSGDVMENKVEEEAQRPDGLGRGGDLETPV